MSDQRHSDDSASAEAGDVAARVEELLRSLSLAEKAGQLTQYFYFGLPAALAEQLQQQQQGSAGESGAGQAGAGQVGDGQAGAGQVGDGQVGDETPVLDPSNIAKQPAMVEQMIAAGAVGSLLFVSDAAEANRLQRMVIDGSPHGIPALFGFDVIHGLRTILPVPIALAASWDPELIERGQAVAAREARAVGIHWAFAPMVDIARDPRWGRIVEGAGEDPYLGAAVAAAQVRGFQGSDYGAEDRIIAGPKHFAGYGAALGGRDYDEVNLSDAELWNVYLPPFRAAVEAGAGNIMTAYMPLNGVPATGNRWLLRDVLRDDFGFTGFTVSDAMAVHNLVTHEFAADPTAAAALGLDAGLDLEMAVAEPAYAHLVEAVEQGRVSERLVDEAVRRVLTAKVRLGLFEQPYVDEQRAAQVLTDPAHREVARVAAQRSAVLLRNEGGVLPLAASGSIAVLGPLADSRRDVIGPWVFDFDLDESVSVLEGIRDRAGDGARVDFAPGVRPAQRTFASMFDMFGGNAPADPPEFDDVAELARAVELAQRCDVAVVVVGEWQNMIGEAASRSSLELPGAQQELIKAVVATGTPTVLVIMNGRPLDLRWAAEHVPAILDVWYPGTQGGTAVADLLFGDAAPGGKLPFTWPRTVGQVPMIYSHTRSHEPANQARRYWDEESTPLFPFGYGLSYTSFGYDGLSLDHDRIAADGSLTVSVQVTNTGDRDGDEVVQLYLHHRSGAASRPVRELKGFTRIGLAAGASRTVSFTVGPDELRYWSAATHDWVVDATTYDVYVGGDSTAELTTTFTVG